MHHGEPMSTEAFTIRSDSTKVKKLDQLANKLDRSRNYLVNQAIEQYLDINAWQILQIKQGIKAADEGRFVSDAEMQRIYNKYKSP
ncbi:MAG: putative transcriptional regulator [Planctomycetota bacterium]|jgi:predicted transcriptional regulator